MLVPNTLTRAAMLALLMGGLAMPAFAAPVDPSQPSGPPNSAVMFDSNGHVVQTAPDTSEVGSGYYAQPGVAAPAMAPQHRMMMRHEAAAHPTMHSPEDMQRHVEERIKTLHAKLMITSDQESEWSDVAQAMRDSEANVGALIQQRHEDAHNMNAVEDLDSYGKIAQAHADGLKRVTAAFASLYSSMSPAQKKNADQVFDTYQGRAAVSGHAGHHVSKAAKTK